MPLRPRNSVRSPLKVRVVASTCEEGNPIGELRVIGVAGQEGAAIRVNFSENVHGGFRPLISHNPFYVARGGEAARPA